MVSKDGNTDGLTRIVSDDSLLSRSYLSRGHTGWLRSRVVSVLDSGAERPRFKLQSRHCWLTVLGKLITPIVPLFTKQQNW